LSSRYRAYRIRNKNVDDRVNNTYFFAYIGITCN